MISAQLMNLLSGFLDQVNSANDTLLPTGVHRGIQSTAAFVRSLNPFLPINDAVIPICTIWFLVFSIFMIWRIGILILNIVRGSGAH